MDECTSINATVSEEDVRMARSTIEYSRPERVAISLNGLADQAARQSSPIDNTVTRYIGILISGRFKTAPGKLGPDPQVVIWASGLSYNDGKQDHFGGTYGPNKIGIGDAPFVMPPNRGNLRLLYEVPFSEAGRAEPFGPASIGHALSLPVPPQKCVLLVENKTGLPLDPNDGGFLEFTGTSLVTA
jgi:hypothetical protein